MTTNDKPGASSLLVIPEGIADCYRDRIRDAIDALPKKNAANSQEAARQAYDVLVSLFCVVLRNSDRYVDITELATDL